MSHKLGQALTEYLLLFAIMGFIILRLFNALNFTLGTSFGSLRVILTRELTTGYCEQEHLCVSKDVLRN